MRRIHLTVWSGSTDGTRSAAFVVLFGLEAACRSLLITIVPLKAYQLLGSAQTVSVLYFLVSVLGLCVSLTVPVLLHRIRRRWVMTTGASCYAVCSYLFSIGTSGALAAALAVQITGSAILDVVINLYLLDHVPRRQLNHFEPKRLLLAGTAFAAGPWLGVYLDRHVAENLTYMGVACLALILLGYFWVLRLSDDVSFGEPRRPPPRPLEYVPRFVSQPRLVLAWALAAGRSGWWLMYFLYAPIYVSAAGFSPEIGGALVSCGLLPMLLMRVWAKIGQHYGVRRLLVGAYGLTGLVTLLAGLVADRPILCMALMGLSAWCATLIDGAGNVPYLRAVRPYERESMTSVFMTFRHVSSLVTPGFFAAVLIVLPLPYVFVTGGAVALGMAALSRHIPRRL